MSFVKRHFIDSRQYAERAINTRRAINSARLPKYCVPYLSDSLAVIAPSELVVIGADTGIGKTHLANHIALKNASAGLKVHLFSLEGDKDEIMLRWLWQIICREYYKNPNGIDMEYMRYSVNGIMGLEEYEDIAYEEMARYEKNLFIYDRAKALDLETFIEEADKIDHSDLIIIDHLHYFDITESESETRGLYKIMKEIKKLTEERKFPVILISHLRKKDKDRGIPGNEEFMGSSNIAKIATTCITMSADSKYHDLENGRFATIMSVTKSRAGACTSLGARLYFKAKYRMYEKGYTLGSIVRGDFVELPTDKYPQWAKGAHRYESE